MSSCGTYLEALNPVEKTSLMHMLYYIASLAIACSVRPADAESTAVLFGITSVFYTTILCSKKALLLCSRARRTELTTNQHFAVFGINHSPSPESAPPSTKMQKALFLLAIISELGVFFAACKRANESEMGITIPSVVGLSLFLKGIAAVRHRKEICKALDCENPEHRPLVTA